MRYARKFAQAQKREEKAIFQCYFEAVGKAKMDGHKRNLGLVQKNMIEGNNDLTIKVWEHFLNVCDELDVNLDPIFNIVKLHPQDLGKGNGYRIPSKETDLLGYTKKRQRRRQWREEFRKHYQSDRTGDIIKKLRFPELRLVKRRVG